MTEHGRRIGRAGLAPGRLSLGTGTLGGLGRTVTAETFDATIAAARDGGICLFDTAPLYGLGVAEERLGAALRDAPADDVIISTKIGRRLRPPDADVGRLEVDSGYEGVWQGVPPKTLVVDFGYDATLRSIEESLARLGREHVDIVYIHDTFEEHHYRDAMAGAYPALERMRADGTIRAIGVGIGRTETLLRFAADGDFDCFLVAGRYTLLDQAGADDLLAACRAREIAIVLGGVFNSGILVDPYAPAPHFDYRPAPATVVARAQNLDHVCAAHGVPLKAAALQFPLAHPVVATVLLGSASPEEVAENVALAGLPIPDGLWRDLKTEGLLPADAVVPQ